MPARRAYHNAMFVPSKIFLFLINPGFWLPVLLVAGTALLWTRWRRAGRWLLTATVALVAFVSVVPVGSLMREVLENRFAAVRTLPDNVDGIIVLGGVVNQFLTRARGQPALTDGAERMTEFVAMARRYPKARLVFTGGSGSVLRPNEKEVTVARMFFEQMGLDVSRIVFEDESRNTWENAVYTHRLMKPKKGETWVLITSAQHMPRSVGVFRKVGWELLPYPVDYTTLGPGERYRYLGIEMIGGFEGLWQAIREWIGLTVYYMLDRTDALLPGPVPAAAAADG